MALMPTPAETEKIAENVYALRDGHVNVYAYVKGVDAVCVDSGFGGPRLKAQFENVGVDPSKVSHIFLTHSDRDHTRGLSMFPNAKILMSKDEEQMTDGRRARFFGLVKNKLPVTKYELLSDGETITVGAIKVTAISTPGHTPGSMSYLIDDCLFTGDTLVLKDGKAKTTMGFINMDTKVEEESIRKLARLSGIRLLATGHSGYSLDFQKAMTEWVK